MRENEGKNVETKLIILENKACKYLVNIVRRSNLKMDKIICRKYFQQK